MHVLIANNSYSTTVTAARANGSYDITTAMLIHVLINQ